MLSDVLVILYVVEISGYISGLCEIRSLGFCIRFLFVVTQDVCSLETLHFIVIVVATLTAF